MFAALSEVLERHGVFGGSKNLGLSNALISIDSLEALPPSGSARSDPDPRGARHRTRTDRARAGRRNSPWRFPPRRRDCARDSPDIAETGANVGAWGTTAVRARDGCAGRYTEPQLLPMPRPPRGLYSAAYHGPPCRSRNRAQSFHGNNVRRIRLAVARPSITLAAHAGGEVRLTLWSPFDDALVEGCRVAAASGRRSARDRADISALAEECRLSEPRCSRNCSLIAPRPARCFTRPDSVAQRRIRRSSCRNGKPATARAVTIRPIRPEDVELERES